MFFNGKSRRAFFSDVASIALLVKLGFAKAQGMLSGINKSDVYIPLKKFALVIGNRDYPDGKDLPPAQKNARDVHEALEYLEFKVTSYVDLDYEKMRLVLTEFIQEMKLISEHAIKGSVAILFYFCGHGFQTSGNNYIVPAGIDPSSQGAVNKSFNLMDDIINKLPNLYPGITIALIDACRTDPNVKKGVDDFNQILVPDGTIVFFASRAGRPALAPIDPLKNTFFTELLVEAFQNANGVTPIDDLFQIVSGKCLNTVSKFFKSIGVSFQPQWPESSSNLRGKFILRNQQLEKDRDKIYVEVSDEELKAAEKQLLLDEASKVTGIKVPDKQQADGQSSEASKLAQIEVKKLALAQKAKNLQAMEENWSIIQNTIKPTALIRLCEDFKKSYPTAVYMQTVEVILLGAKNALKAQRIADMTNDSLEDPAGAENMGYRDDLVDALRGDKDSAFRIAMMYQGGDKLMGFGQKSILPENPRKVEQWLKFSAELGNGIASWYLANIYIETGQQADSAKYERRAIELGFTPPPRLANRGY